MDLKEKQGRLGVMEERVFSTTKDILLPKLREDKSLTEKDVVLAMQKAMLFTALYEAGLTEAKRALTEQVNKLVQSVKGKGKK